MCALNVMQKHASILVVDDDRRIRELLQRYLTENGFLVTVAADASEARKKLNEDAYDLVVLDVMMPGETGFQLTQAIKNNPLHPAYHTPIIFLTAMSEGENRIEGLEKGADDYLAKPFEPKELILRIHKILDRMHYSMKVERSIQLGKFSFDIERGELSHNDKPISLTSAELNLLRVFAFSPGRPISREDLAAKTGVSLSPRTVDVQVTRLRRKIEEDPREPQFLKTVRHKGYVLWPE